MPPQPKINPNENLAALAEKAGVSQAEAFNVIRPSPELNPDVTVGGALDIRRATEAGKQIATPGGSQARTDAAGNVVGFGPTPPLDGVVGSSDDVVSFEDRTKDTVGGLGTLSESEERVKTASEDFLTQLSTLEKDLETQRKGRVGAVEQQFGAAAQQLETAQEREAGTVSTALTSVGGYLGTQISGVGVLLTLGRSHRNETAALEAKRAAAIQAANSAVDDKQFQLALAKAEEGKQLARDIESARTTFFNNMVKLSQEQRDLAEFNRETAGATLDSIAASGATPSNEYFDMLAETYQLSRGEVKGMFSISRRNREIQNITDVQQLQSAENALALQVMQMKDSLPFGTPFNIGNDTYYGTDRGALEINEEGFGTSIEFDPTTGQAKATDVGFVGKAKGPWKVVDSAQGLMTFNPETNTFLPAYATLEGWSNVIPEGTDLGTLTDPTTGQPFKGECGEYSRLVSGIRVGNSLTEKTSLIDESLDSSNVKIGDIMVWDVGTENGHVSVLKEVVNNPDGTKSYRFTDANWNGDGKVRQNPLPIKEDDPRLKGFIKGTVQPDFVSGSDTRVRLTAPGDVDVAASLEGLSLSERLEAKSLSVDIFGKRAGTKAENVNDVAALIRSGLSADEVKDQLRFAGQSPEFTGSVRNAAENIAVAGKMSAARQENFFNNLDRNIEAGNIDKALDTMKIAAISTFGVDEQKQVRGKDRTVEFLLDIKDDFKDYVARNGDTNIFDGTTEKIFGKVGTVRDPELRKLATKLATAIQGYRRSMSGVAFSVPESKEYKAIFPNIDKRFRYNEAVVDALTETFVGDLDFTLGSVMGPGTYSELFGAGGATVGGQKLESGSLSEQVAEKGFDFQAMKDAGHTDEEIKEAVGL